MVMDPRMTVGMSLFGDYMDSDESFCRSGLRVRWSDGLVIFDGMAEDARRYA